MALEEQALETPATPVRGTSEAGVAEQGLGELSFFQVARQGELHLHLARAAATGCAFDEALKDAMAALGYFDQAGEAERAADAASLAAVCAGQVGLLSLGAELAARSIVALRELQDDSLVATIAFRMGVFQWLSLDYARASEHFELAGRAAQKAGDSFGVSGGLYNAASVLLESLHVGELFHLAQERGGEHESGGVHEKVSAILRRLASEAPSATLAGLGAAWLEAGLLVGQTKPGAALVVIDRARAKATGWPTSIAPRLPSPPPAPCAPWVGTRRLSAKRTKRWICTRRRAGTDWP